MVWTVMMHDISLPTNWLWDFCILLCCNDMLWGEWLLTHWYLSIYMHVYRPVEVTTFRSLIAHLMPSTLVSHA